MSAETCGRCIVTCHQLTALDNSAKDTVNFVMLFWGDQSINQSIKISIEPVSSELPSSRVLSSRKNEMKNEGYWPGTLYSEKKRAKDRTRNCWQIFGKSESAKCHMKLLRPVSDVCSNPVKSNSCNSKKIVQTMQQQNYCCSPAQHWAHPAWRLSKRPKCHTWMGQQTETKDIITVIKWNKHRRAGQVARFMYNKWTIRATECSPRHWKWSREQPKPRWCDGLTHHLGSTRPVQTMRDAGSTKRGSSLGSELHPVKCFMSNRAGSGDQWGQRLQKDLKGSKMYTCPCPSGITHVNLEESTGPPGDKVSPIYSQSSTASFPSLVSSKV